MIFFPQHTSTSTLWHTCIRTHKRTKKLFTSVVDFLLQIALAIEKYFLLQQLFACAATKAVYFILKKIYIYRNKYLHILVHTIVDNNSEWVALVGCTGWL